VQKISWSACEEDKTHGQKINYSNHAVLIYRFTFFFLLLQPSFLSYGQNLVPNGSFEERSECIYNDSNIEFAPPWFNIQPDNFVLTNASPDTFHECMIFNTEPCQYPDVTFLDPWFLGVPANAAGCEAPVDGQGYAGIMVYFSNPDPVDGYREYLSVPLTEELEAGEIYEVSLWVSLAERATHAIWNLQVLFSNDPIEQGLQAEPFTDVQPQLNGTPDEYLDERDGWEEMTWEYTAQGDENYLTIGNFELNSQTDTARVWFGSTNNHFFPGVYYYIDDVSVEQKTLDINKPDSYDLSIYPSPFEDFLNIECTRMINAIFLMGLDGKLVYYSSDHFLEKSIELSEIPSGMYLLRTELGEYQSHIQKVIKR